jgi:hypothetical protein
MDEPQAMNAPNGHMNLIIAEAHRISFAADELKRLESASLTPDELSDAWDHAYGELYRANEALKAALAQEAT